jgi:putative YhbY family RNA-binding protein
MCGVMSLTLTSRERAALKARAHHLKPIVRLGHVGVSEAFIAEVGRALGDHELIKVQIDITDRDERHAAADEICARTGAAPVQRVGKVVVLWRPKPDDPAQAPA